MRNDSYYDTARWLEVSEIPPWFAALHRALGGDTAGYKLSIDGPIRTWITEVSTDQVVARVRTILGTARVAVFTGCMSNNGFMVRRYVRSPQRIADEVREVVAKRKERQGEKERDSARAHSMQRSLAALEQDFHRSAKLYDLEGFMLTWSKHGTPDTLTIASSKCMVTTAFKIVPLFEDKTTTVLSCLTLGGPAEHKRLPLSSLLLAGLNILKLESLNYA